MNYRKLGWRANTALMASVVAFSGALAPAVMAQVIQEDDAAATSRVARDVITVTARKTEETLQTVPVTVSAISGQDLERFQYDKLEDIVTRVPSLNVQVGGSGSGGQISLRGVGSSNISAAFDSAVAFDFDGVQVSTMRIVQSAFFDLEQIEILKGPQSLFFGKSASAGVVSLKSANPTDEFEVGGKASYEFEERGYTVEAYVSGPVTDELGFRLAAQFNDINRQFFNTAPVDDPKYGQENINVRGTLQWDPGDNFSANLKLNYVGHRNDGAIGNAIVDCGQNGVVDDISLLGGGFLIDAGYSCDDSGKVFFLPDSAPPLSVQGAEQDINNGIAFGKSDIFYGVLTWDWNITDDIVLTSVTGYLDQKALDYATYSYAGVRDGISFGAGGSTSENLLEQVTQEVRISTDFDAPINLVLGVFYEHRDIQFNTNQQAVNISLVAGPDALTGNTTDWFKRHLYDNEAFSIFGQVRWDLTDNLELSGGVRWTDERKVNNILVPYVHSALSAGGGFVQSGFVSEDIIFKDDNLSPEVTLSWQATDDINLYASYKTGFKSGGIDNSALPSAGLLGLGSDNPDVVRETEEALIFDSETAEGGELGMKSEWFDQTFTFNVALFYYVFDDLQIQNFDPIKVQFFTTNAGQVTSKGVDIDFFWVTPVDGLSIYGALAYTDTKFSEFFDPNENGSNLDGRATGRAPKWSGNIAADWRTPFGNGMEFGLTGNLKFSSSYFTNEDSLNDLKQGGFATLDLAASISDVEGRWQVSVVGNNITDKIFINTSSGRPFLAAGGDDLIRTVNRGRTVFLEVSFRY